MKRILIIAASLLAVTGCQTWNDFASKGSKETSANVNKNAGKTATASSSGKATAGKKNADLLASMVEPSGGQTIKIVTSPSDANCAVDRDGMTIERLNGENKQATFPKTGKDLLIRCLKSGYSENSYLAKANYDNSYQNTVEIKLKAKPIVTAKKK